MRLLLSTFLFVLLNTNSVFSGEVITIFGNEYKPPKIWSTKDGIHKGILIEVMREVEKELDVKFQFKTFPWARTYKMARNAKGGITGISFTDERNKTFDFNNIPLFNDTMVFITKKGSEFKFETIKDLKNKKIGYCRGCSFGKRFEEAKNYFIPIETDDSREQRLAMVLDGKIDAAILGPGEYALRKICKDNKNLKYEWFSILPKPLTVDPNYLAFAKELNRKELLDKFDTALQMKIEKGVIDDIIKRIMDESL